MAYCRLEDTFRYDQKPRRLAKALGVHRVHGRGLVAGLLSWAVTNAPDGFLGDADPEEIAEACDWDGDESALVDALIAVGILDRKRGKYEIHGYYARAESYRRAAQRRESREKKKKRTSQTRRRHVADTSQTSDEGGDNLSAREERRGKERRGEEKKGEDAIDIRPASSGQQVSTGAKGAKAPGLSVEIQTVWQAYRRHHPRCPGTLTSKRKEYRLVKDRLGEGYSVADLLAAIEGYHLSRWHQGDNDRGHKYDSLELIMRDGSKVQRGIEMSEDPTIRHAISGKTRKALMAAAEWARKEE